jgi:hypothetical protein
MDGDGPHQILMGDHKTVALFQGKASPQAAIGGGDGHGNKKLRYRTIEMS